MREFYIVHKDIIHTAPGHCVVKLYPGYLFEYFTLDNIILKVTEQIAARIVLDGGVDVDIRLGVSWDMVVGIIYFKDTDEVLKKYDIWT